MQGILQLNANDRWEINDGDRQLEISSGSVVQLRIAGQWLTTRIEHNGLKYYAVDRGINLCDGLEARTLPR